MIIKPFFTLPLLTFSLIFALHTTKADDLQSTIASDQRTAKFKVRDDYRHPYETLSFFGLQADQTVVELTPGGGYYTEILAPYLQEKGLYIAAGFDPNAKHPYYQKSAKNFTEKLSANPALYSKVKQRILQLPYQLDIADDNSVDLVVTFRNTHNWVSADKAEAVFTRIAQVLKPGGVLGLVQHRADSAKVKDLSGKLGYLDTKQVIQFAEKAGLTLVASSEINANKKDTKDYAKGVWMLPPVLRGGEEDKSKYLSIGESDRMTLKFTKALAK